MGHDGRRWGRALVTLAPVLWCYLALGLPPSYASDVASGLSDGCDGLSAGERNAKLPAKRAAGKLLRRRARSRLRITNVSATRRLPVSTGPEGAETRCEWGVWGGRCRGEVGVACLGNSCSWAHLPGSKRVPAPAGHSGSRSPAHVDVQFTGKDAGGRSADRLLTFPLRGQKGPPQTRRARTGLGQQALAPPVRYLAPGGAGWHGGVSAAA